MARSLGRLPMGGGGTIKKILGAWKTVNHNLIPLKLNVMIFN